MNKKVFARFWSKVAVRKPAQCWRYTGGLDQDGYGVFSDIGGKPVRAHRFAFRCATGRYATGMTLHDCDTPSCCNPGHLYDGTAKSNTADSIARGRYKTVFVNGERHPNAKISDSQMREARRMLALGHSKRSIADRLNVTPSAMTYRFRTGAR